MRKCLSVFTASVVVSVVAGWGEIQAAPAEVDRQSIVAERPDGESSLMTKYSKGYEVYLEDYALDMVSNGSVVEMIEESDGITVWFNNPTIGLVTLNWYKGEKDGDKILVKGPQEIALDPNYGEPLYLMPCEYYEDEWMSWYRPTSDKTFAYEVVDGKVVSFNPDLVLGLCYKTGDDDYKWAGYGDYDITMTPHTAKALSLPEGVSVEEWTLSDGQMGHAVKVGVDGDTMYIGGVLPSLPDTYIKGHISGQEVTFDSNQYLGIDESRLCDAYFIGAVDNSFYNEYGEHVVLFDMLESISFHYDDDAGILSNDSEAILVNAGTVYTNKIFSANHPTIKILGREAGTPPLAPEFTDVMWYEPDYGFGVFAYMVPNIDVNGAPLDTDNLYYKVFYNGEEVEFYPDECPGLTEPTVMIPYNFYDNVGIYGDDTGLRTIIYYSDGVETISLQSVYMESDGTEVLSELATIENSQVGISGVANESPVKTVYYNLSGTEVSPSAKGVKIEKKTYSDGTVRIKKILTRQ